jgi:hypothetical protein
MKHLLFAILFAMSLNVNASEMVAVPTAKNLIAEIWCVEGFKFLYVEKTTNETFQFFQLTKNGGMAPKVIECTGTEDRVIGNG